MSDLIVRVIDLYIYRYENSEIKFLLLKRSKDRIYENLWQGVTGKIEDNESPWETAIRELYEETGLKPHKAFVVDYVSKFYEHDKGRINLIPVFAVEVKEKEINLSKEHSRYQWLNYKNAKKKLTWRGQKKGIKEVFKMLNSTSDRLKWSKIS